MKLHWSDWNRACISAAVLLALAALAVFKIPHGFEEGVGWYLCLLPDAIFAAAISDLIQKVIPQSKSIVFDTLLISCVLSASVHMCVSSRFPARYVAALFSLVIG